MDIEITESVDTPEDFGADSKSIAKRWQLEIQLALKKRERAWREKGRKIVKRYLHESDSIDDTSSGENFSMLWSNVQTMKPAVYAQTPKPMVDRRYKQKDPIARTASELLERPLEYFIQPEYFDSKAEACVLDFLLPGRAQMWVRYVPHEMTERVDVEPVTNESGELVGYKKGSGELIDSTASEIEILEDKESGGHYYETSRIAYEEVVAEHVHWEDYTQGPSAEWEDCPWVARRVKMRKDAAVKRFDDPKLVDAETLEAREGRSVGELLQFGYTSKSAEEALGEKATETTRSAFQRAEVWEIWDRESKTTYWISPGCNYLLDKEEDSLNLDGFFPCPKPLLATTGPDSMIPTPDFCYYEKQADYIDDLTHRKHILTEALRVVGVCPDEHQEQLARLIEETDENDIIPIEDWPRFIQDGGLPQMVQFFPLEVIANTLKFIIELIEVEKAQLYEISGISDIVRGMTNPNETATAQNRKSQFATSRFRDKQMDVQRFFRDVIAIQGEIIAEKFSPKTLVDISGLEPEPPMPAPQLPPIDSNAPPEQQQQMQAEVQAAQREAAQDQARFEQEMAKLEAAVQLLRDDKMRLFRIDIETDSTIEADQQQDKETSVEYMQSVGKFMEQYVKFGEVAPQFAKVMGNTMLFVARRFRAGRLIEGELEEATEAYQDSLKAKSQQQPPNPEMMKVQMQQQAKQAELQIKTQAEQAKIQLDQQKAQLEHQREMEKIRLEHEREMTKIQAQAEAKEKDAIASAVSGLAQAEVKAKADIVEQNPIVTTF